MEHIYQRRFRILITIEDIEKCPEQTMLDLLDVRTANPWLLYMLSHVNRFNFSFGRVTNYSGGTPWCLQLALGKMRLQVQAEQLATGQLVGLWPCNRFATNLSLLAQSCSELARDTNG